jgi:Mg2+-importing ATPase
LSSVFDFITFAVLFRMFHADEATFQTAWFVVSALTELVALLVLRTSGASWRSMASPALFWSTLAVAALVLVAPYAGRTAAIFGFVPLSGTLVVASLVIVAAYGAANEIAKVVFYRGTSAARRPALAATPAAAALTQDRSASR